LRVSEWGVFRTGDAEEPQERDVWSGEYVAGREEADVYAAVGMPWIPPELREDRGEIEAAERGQLPELVSQADLRGDLQMHSTWSDGRESIETMVSACERLGYDYVALTDHSQALAMTGGLGPKELREQWKELDEVARRHPGIRVLRSLEVDILADGTLDLDDEMLAELDLVVVSVHSRFALSSEEQTRRIVRALRHPQANVLGHPTGRMINRRPPYEVDMEEVLKVAAEQSVAVEINAQPDRLDLRDTLIMRAKELGVRFAISTDSHRTTELAFMRYGVEQARRAWVTPAEVVNAWPLDRFLAWAAA
jgi:DNA polymerase (family 10)